MPDITNVQNFRHAGAYGNTGTSVDGALKEFADMVLLAYEENLFIDSLHKTMSIGGGASSYQFPVMGKGTATYHEAGDNLLTDEDASGTDYNQAIKSGERLIYADKKLVASEFIDDLDQKIIHYEYRQMLAEMLARAVRLKSETNKIQTLYNTGLIAADSLFTGSTGGTVIENSAMLTNPHVFVSEIFQAKQNMDEDDVPKDGRYLMIPPYQSKLMFEESSGSLPSFEWINKDFRGAGSIADGVVARIAGFMVVESNHIPTTAGTTYGAGDYNIFDTAGSPTGNDYSVTVPASKGTGAIAFQYDAMATLSLEGLQVRAKYMDQYLGWLVYVTKVEGSGPLRPECVNILRATS